MTVNLQRLEQINSSLLKWPSRPKQWLRAKYIHLLYTCGLNMGGSLLPRVENMRWTHLTLLALCCLMHARGDQTVMKDVTLGFGQALEKCREESGLTEEKMEEFFHFWHDDFKFVHRELGCAILCMSNHFNLLTETSRMHHENTDKFIKSFPNGEILAKQMVEMIHTCELRFESEPDHCARILLVAECFRDTCKSTNLAPTMEILMAEFILQAEAGKR